MPIKRVAVEGDVVATPGTVLFEGADSGAWTAGKIDVSTYKDLTILQKKAIYSASCTFSFSGKSGNTPVTGTEQIIVNSSSTLLMKDRFRVLADGDTITGKYGNKLTIKCATTKLRTS